MKITIIGTGYVGLVSGVCFASLGHDVTCVDVDKDKINSLRKGIIPIYEPGLEQLLIDNTDKGLLKFSTNLKTSIYQSTVIFIAVGTPMSASGCADLSYVKMAASEIGRCVEENTVVVNKSTVPVGTGDMVENIINQELMNRGTALQIDVVSNPEFLKEGDAISDFLQPDRIVIGSESLEATEVMRSLYTKVLEISNANLYSMARRDAELTKYAANAMLAARISFVNEIAEICDKVGADFRNVRLGMGSDKRIGLSFTSAGLGYGGSCFPKDVLALSETAKQYGANYGVIEAITQRNERQKLYFEQKILSSFDNSLVGKTITILGLSFKPETDDVREASASKVSDFLLSQGALVRAFDPIANSQFACSFPQITDHENFTLCTTALEAIEASDALILVTEWNEFKNLCPIEIGKLVGFKKIFDGRNCLNKQDWIKQGWSYFGVGC